MKTLKNYACWQKLETALNELNIEFDFLEGTKDIWVRDIMPLVSPEILKSVIEKEIGHELRSDFID